MAKIERIDSEDSFTVTFRVEINPNQYQEIQVPIFLADVAEKEIAKQSFDFDLAKAKTGKKNLVD